MPREGSSLKEICSAAFATSTRAREATKRRSCTAALARVSARLVTMRHPKPEKGGRGKKLAGNGEFSGVSHQRVADARAVLSYSRELAEVVMWDTSNPCFRWLEMVGSSHEIRRLSAWSMYAFRGGPARRLYGRSMDLWHMAQVGQPGSWSRWGFNGKIGRPCRGADRSSQDRA